MRKTYKQGVEDGKKELTEKELEKRVSETLRTVNPDDVFSFDKTLTNLFLGKRKIESTELNDLKGDVVYFRQSNLWKVLNETVRYQAMEVMFTKSQTFEDMRQGKAFLYALDVFDRVMFAIEKSKIDGSSTKRAII